MPRLCLTHIAACVLFVLPAFAQTAAPPGALTPMPPAAGTPAPAAAPSEEALKLARTLTEKTGGGGISAMEGLSLPMAQLVRQLHVGPMHANAIVNEVIIPTLADHSDELSAIQAQSYATTLSIDDMKAAIAFYDSPAGQDLVKGRSRMMSGNLNGVTKLIDSLEPEFEKRTDAALTAHGWTRVMPPQMGGPRAP